MNYRACLDQCSLALLRQIAVAHGVALPELPARAEVVRVVLERLLAPGYLDSVTANLAAEQREPLVLVAAEGGEIRGFVLERRLRQGAAPEQAHVTDLLSDLTQRGLLFRTFHAVGPERGEVFILPDELLSL